MDISNLSRKELEDLRKNVDKTLSRLAKKERDDALAAAEKAAREFGFSLNELTGSAGAKAERSAPKYRNPDNAEQTWSGRGRQPAWYKTAVASGTTPEMMEI